MEYEKDGLAFILPLKQVMKFLTLVSSRKSWSERKLLKLHEIFSETTGADPGFLLVVQDFRKGGLTAKPPNEK